MPRAKVDLIKRTICKEADDNQLALFLHVCEAHGLDPVRKQIYAIFFNNDESRAGRGPKDMVMITGIDGLAMMAARDHKDYGGVSSAKYTWFEPNRLTPAKRRMPETATVKIYRKGCEAIEVTVDWEEFSPRDLTDKRSDFWNRMPKNQLEKCCQAKAIRRNFPGLGNIFVIEEMAQRMTETTPGDRQIVDGKGFSLSGTAITYGAQQHSKVSAEVDRQIAEHKNAGEKKAFAGSIEIDYSTDENNPIIRCSSAEVLEVLKTKCNLQWGKDEFWHITSGRDLGAVEEIRIQYNFERIEIMPTKPVPPKTSGNSERRPGNKNTSATAGKKEKDVSGKVSSPISSRARLVPDCYIKSTELKTTPNTKVPYLVMLVKNGSRAVWMSTFNHKFFDWLIKAREHSVDCELYIEDSEKHGPNIVGIKRIGNVGFDGKNPIPKKSNETPAQSLFDQK
jgi:phage recombination protein Bet